MTWFERYGGLPVLNLRSLSLLAKWAVPSSDGGEPPSLSLSPRSPSLRRPTRRQAFLSLACADRGEWRPCCLSSPCLDLEKFHRLSINCQTLTPGRTESPSQSILRPREWIAGASMARGSREAGRQDVKVDLTRRHEPSAGQASGPTWPWPTGFEPKPVSYVGFRLTSGTSPLDDGHPVCIGSIRGAFRKEICIIHTRIIP
ncbi:hypothetical protein QBC47DRAFT_12064 [Echria macrotheca]|uniref:Uncharacterized protein n=1 Tax=Echria macrotheca TaxID=438768 RepID=A0AAJ0BLX0_9PEZI|nr:hypothetical protein QBC47DRAFT_12064 [Echria macrotheca]